MPFPESFRLDLTAPAVSEWNSNRGKAPSKAKGDLVLDFSIGFVSLGFEKSVFCPINT